MYQMEEESTEEELLPPIVTWQHVWPFIERQEALANSCFGCLSTEILIKIFLLLSVRDLGNVGLVCRTFKMVIDLDDIWKNKCTNTSHHVYFKTFDNQIARKPDSKSFKQFYMDQTYTKNTHKEPGAYYRKQFYKYSYLPMQRKNMLKNARFTVLFWCFSISFIFLEKYVFGLINIGFDVPLIIKWYQFVILIGIISILVQLNASAYFYSINNASFFSMKFLFVLKVFSISILHCLIIIFFNLVCKHMNISFNLFGYALFNVTNIVLSCICFPQETSFKRLPCISIGIGFLLGINQGKVMGIVSVLCVVYGIIGSYFIVFYIYCVKRYMDYGLRRRWYSSLHIYFNTSVLLIPMMFISGEGSLTIQYSKLFHLTFWMVMIAPVILQFALLQRAEVGFHRHILSSPYISMTTFLQICITVLFYTESKRILWWISNVCVLIGSSFFWDKTHIYTI